MFRKALLTVGLIAIASAPLQAQVPVLDIRIGAHGVLPTGDTKDAFDAGLGAYVRAGLPLLAFKLMGSATYNQFKAINPLVDDVNEVTLQLGPHFSPIPLLDIGIEGAYFMEAEEFGLSPNISVGFLMFEATASYNTTFGNPKASWMTLGVGIRF